MPVGVGRVQAEMTSGWTIGDALHPSSHGFPRWKDRNHQTSLFGTERFAPPKPVHSDRTDDECNGGEFELADGEAAVCSSNTRHDKPARLGDRKCLGKNVRLAPIRHVLLVKRADNTMATEYILV